MTFRIFRDSTTADAADMNDNFYHIGKGTILPLGGSYLAPTDSVYNLGSSTYKWKNAFVGHIDCSDINYSGSITSDKIWTLLYEYNVDSTHTTTARIEITGLNGDNDKMYMVWGSGAMSTSYSMRIFLNGSSSASDYEVATFRCSGHTATVVTYGYSSPTSGIVILYESDTITRGIIYSVYSPEHPLCAGLITNMYCSTDGSYLENYNYIYNGTTISSVVIACSSGDMVTGSSIRLYKKGS